MMMILVMMMIAVTVMMVMVLIGMMIESAWCVTVVMAGGLIYTEPEVLKSGWLHVKLALVLLLIGYHHYCRRIMKKLAKNECQWTGQQFRALNEAPTVFLVLIVLLAVFKNSLPLDLTTWLIAGLVLTMIITIQLYAKKRRRDKERLEQEPELASSSVGE